MFGKVQEVPQTEKTFFYPRSPYGFAKLFAHWATVNYRESYGIFGVSGILFNHESPLRGQEFVTRKITNSVARIELGKQEVIELGNLDAKRDWGYAKEYVDGMYRMLQINEPKTFVLSSNQTHTVKEFVDLSFQNIGVTLNWKGAGIDERGYDSKTGKLRVLVNPKYFRPAEVDLLMGDSSKAKNELNWAATTTIENLCKIMVEADLTRNKNGVSF